MGLLFDTALKITSRGGICLESAVPKIQSAPGLNDPVEFSLF